MSTPLEATIESMGHHGQGVVRINGKVHFVPDAIPGSTVAFEVIEDHKHWARGRLVEVLEGGPFAARAVCAHAQECGGCQWQSADLAAQLEWKRSIVVDQLERIGRIPDPPVGAMKSVGPPFGYRNRMDFVVTPEGRPGLHRRRSDDLVTVTECPVMRPEIEELVSAIDFPGLNKVTLRVGVRTGERLAVVDGVLPEAAADWGISVCTVDRGKATAVIGSPHVHEVVAGAKFRITASAFFQNNTGGADALAEVVAAAAGRGGTLLDLYAGGGLFSCTVGRRFDRVIAVESASLAKADFRHNAAGLDHVELVPGRVEKSKELAAQHTGATVIADPPRSGLGRRGVDVVLAAAPERVVLVSCDPASLGRDARFLTEGGYRLVESTPLDLFPQTFHVEVVSSFVRE